jgi:hypothetical protein
MKTILLAACAAIALSGCVTAEEMAALDDKTCHSYGAPTGSALYVQCRMVKDQQHVEERAVAMAQFQHGLDMMAEATRPPPTLNVHVY